MKQSSPTLGDDEAHVWYTRTAAWDTPSQRALYRTLLNTEESERLRCLASDDLRLEYLVTRTLCRTVLSAYVNRVAPYQWRFRTNAHGRPEIVGNGSSVLRFNLSNAGSVVVCAVTRSADIGIDVEEVGRCVDLDDIAETYFTIDEKRTLRGLPAKQRRGRFFELWTLKESYIKARGLGLSLALDLFSFEVHGQSAHVVFDSRLADDADKWQFALLDIGACYRMALSIRRDSRPLFRFQVHEIVPDPDQMSVLDGGADAQAGPERVACI